MRNLVLLGSFIVIISMQVYGQISYGGQPLSWSTPVKQNSQPVNLTLNNTYNKPAKQNENSGSLEFAYVINVDLNSEVNGETQLLSDGRKIWRLHLISEGAYSLNFTFSKFFIPPGAELFVYSPDKTEILGAFTNENQKESGVFAVAPIKGDELIIEYNEPANVDYEGYFEIQSVGHDYLNIFGKKDGFFGESGECNIDINCDEGKDWQIVKRSVCRMIINNRTLCTGVLVNNTSQDATPYLLTANHCIEENSDAENTIFYFNYESPSCGGSDGDVSKTISGAQLISEKGSDEAGYLDFSLLELSVNVPRSYNPYFAGWNAENEAAEHTTCIHHPWADVKKISIDNDPPVVASYSGFGYDENVFWKVLEWDAGTTEKGSSGSPLFDQNKRVVGNLSGGEASCSNSVNDLFQMFSVSYDSYEDYDLQLKHWLDPLNLGVRSLDGYAPYSDNVVHHIDAVYHYDPDEKAAAYVTPEGGYVSGNNEYGDLAKAEFFELSEFENRLYVTGGFAYFFIAKGNNETEVEFFIAENNNGTPGKDLASASLSLEAIKYNVQNSSPCRFEFYDPIKISSDVFAGIRLPQTVGDTIALLNSTETPLVNTAWEQNASEIWLPYSSTSSWGDNFMNYLAVESGWLVDVEESAITESALKVYPNPVNDEFAISLQSSADIQSVRVYNTVGQLVYNETNKSVLNLDNINVSSWIDGLYIVHVKTTNETHVARIVVRH